jgi:hypothetical protein
MILIISIFYLGVLVEYILRSLSKEAYKTRKKSIRKGS